MPLSQVYTRVDYNLGRIKTDRAETTARNLAYDIHIEEWNTAMKAIEELCSIVAGGGAAVEWQEEGGVISSRSIANFIGAAVTVADDPGNNRVNVTISAAALTASAPANVTKAAALVGVSAEAARADHKHDITTTTPVSTGLTNQEGTSSSLARADHQHRAVLGVSKNSGAVVGSRPVANLIEGTSVTLTITDDAGDDEVDITISTTAASVGATLPTTIQPDDAASAGVSTDAARADHTHAFTSAIAGAILIGDAAAEGVATSHARSDHTHSLAAPGTPAQLGAGVSATGVATAPARGDHEHRPRVTIGAVNVFDVDTTGVVAIQGGTGAAAGAGKAVSVVAGDGGTGDTAGGTLTLDAGNASGAGLDGILFVGATNAREVLIGRAGASLVQLHGAAVSSVTPGRTEGTRAVATPIGFSPSSGLPSCTIEIVDGDPNGQVSTSNKGSLALDVANARLWQKSADSLSTVWLRVDAAGATLQTAYEAGEVITLNDTRKSVEILDSGLTAASNGSSPLVVDGSALTTGTAPTIDASAAGTARPAVYRAIPAMTDPAQGGNYGMALRIAPATLVTGTVDIGIVDGDPNGIAGPAAGTLLLDRGGGTAGKLWRKDADSPSTAWSEFATGGSGSIILTSTAPVDVTKAAAAVGTGTTAARHDHKHDVSTAVTGAILIGDAAAEGTATSLARSDHKHSLASPAAPADVTKAAASAGAATGPARADHKHDVSTAAPVATGSANAEGTATSLARSDHVHDWAGLTVRKNTGADVGTRRRVNVIEGSNITLTVTDDGVGGEVDITIAAAGGATPSLQSVYADGGDNDVPITTADGSIILRNSTDVTNLLELHRTFAGAGAGLLINMGASTTGIGLDIQGDGAGRALTVDYTSDGNLGVEIYHGGATGTAALIWSDSGANALRTQVSDGGVALTAESYGLGTGLVVTGVLGSASYTGILAHINQAACGSGGIAFRVQSDTGNAALAQDIQVSGGACIGLRIDGYSTGDLLLVRPSGVAAFTVQADRDIIALGGDLDLRGGAGAAATVGKYAYLIAGAGGAASAGAVGGTGGGAVLQSGAGGDAGTAQVAGPGGLVTVAGSNGGAGNAANNRAGGIGGDVSVGGGPGGAAAGTAAGRAGGPVVVFGGTGGAAGASAAGGSGAALTAKAGAGGASSSAQAAGAAGQAEFAGGVGGANSASGIGGAGGLNTVRGGHGGTSSSGVGGAGGPLYLYGGNGQNGTTGGLGGTIEIVPGANGTGGNVAAADVVLNLQAPTGTGRPGIFQFGKATGRSLPLCWPYVNKSGGALAVGDVVVIDTTVDQAVTTTTSAGSTLVAGVVAIGGAADETVWICQSGICKMRVYGAAVAITRGAILGTHTTAGGGAVMLVSVDGKVIAKALAATTSDNVLIDVWVMQR